jgi:hypothetical protein
MKMGEVAESQTFVIRKATEVFKDDVTATRGEG